MKTDPSGLGFFSWVADAYDAVVEVASNVVETVVQVAQKVFETVVAGGRTLYAESVAAFKAGVDTVQYIVEKSGQTLMVIGDFVVEAAADTARYFAEKLKDMGKSFVDLWDKVKGFGPAAADVMKAIVTDPGRFLTTLKDGVIGGFERFIDSKKILGNLQEGLFKWLGGPDGGLELPKTFDGPGIAQSVLKFVGLDYDNLQALLVKNVGAENVALAVKLYEGIEQYEENGGITGLLNFLKEKVSYTADNLWSDALSYGMKYLGTHVLPFLTVKLL